MQPANEMGVIVHFAQECHKHGYKIFSIGSAFPDAIIEDESGSQYRVEFEYVANNFKAHGHDPAGADLIICWRNNYPGAPLPILALNEWRLYEAGWIPPKPEPILPIPKPGKPRGPSPLKGKPREWRTVLHVDGVGFRERTDGSEVEAMVMVGNYGRLYTARKDDPQPWPIYMWSLVEIARELRQKYKKAYTSEMPDNAEVQALR